MANSLINWFKNKITFSNGSLPAINDVNLNDLQSKIESDLSDFVQGDLINNIPIANENLESTNLNDAINELAEGNVGNASDITYDDTETSLGVANVQEAIKALLGTITSNTNGIAIKLPIGIMICMKTVTLSSLNVNTASGNLYISEFKSLGDFAESFKSTPTITADVTIPSTSGYVGNIYAHAAVSASSAGSVQISRGSSSTGGTYIVNVIAIGYWK